MKAGIPVLKAGQHALSESRHTKLEIQHRQNGFDETLSLQHLQESLAQLNVQPPRIAVPDECLDQLDQKHTW